MNTSNSLLELADIIKCQSSAIYDLLNEMNVPQPSFSYPTSPESSMTVKIIEDRRSCLLEALDDLRALILGPEAYIFHTAMLSPSWTATLNVLYRYKVAYHVPKDGSISYSELSMHCGLAEPDTVRIIRAATSLRIFEEDPIGFVKHNAASAILATSPAHDAIGFATEEYSPAALMYAESLQRFPNSNKAGESPCAIVNGSIGDRDIFSLIAHDPSRVDRVANAMTWVLDVPETSADHFLNNVPWLRVGGGRHYQCPKIVVDVGGSRGGLCETLLTRFPSIEQAIVEDLPEVTEKNLERQIPEEVSGRIKYQAYDFFTEQVIKNADVYIFRTVIHDWPDSYAIKILRNQIPALKQGAIILINDICIEPSQWKPCIKNQTQSAHDIMVKMALNAKERTKREWEELLLAADEGFRIASIVSPANSAHSIIEIVWEGGLNQA
ncbi:S-adenosyl-L-methionine-dependent methyltransferase [Annulohypoxylon maeteangense]|uniref:S-adenosyl-L-methionine-dependent methyltransferase n=1 Tax=Annulohypoxylon maeteangense TaxID=1927788 RepID=UPI002007B7E5|nr:S-adenosyl-L-methionine-dependent methyltransferase [Annulohypoxylon maeteangense]KAI0886388.1 S-adenosyl-L-methionine-dependent methyltransferase [Annulohypoxylon maeteangense]